MFKWKNIEKEIYWFVECYVFAVNAFSGDFDDSHSAIVDFHAYCMLMFFNSWKKHSIIG